MKIEMWDIDRPKDYPKNPRTWSKQAIAKVGDSIKAFGWRQPVVVDKHGVIVIGHLRRVSGKSVGETQCPVHVADNLSAEKIRALRLADNRVSEESDWNTDLLAQEFADLKALDFDLSLTGFNSNEIDGFTITPDPAEDEIPEVPAVPVTRAGDLWLMGPHRLLCGDSTDAESVARVMDGKKAGLMNTDPPYGVSYNNADRPNPGVAKPRVAKPRVANDEFKDDELQNFLESCFRCAVTCALNSNAAWYLWHAHLTQGFFAAAAAAAAVILHRQIIWVKPVLLLGRGQYHWKHEPCFMGWVEGNRPPDYGERNQTTVWEVGSVTSAERKEFNHSTPKPVELFRRPILKHLKHGEICYEPFAGSGPQFIAAELTERVCFGLELEPAHCDVIVARWQKLTSKHATLEGDGRTFEEIAFERTNSAVSSTVD